MGDQLVGEVLQLIPLREVSVDEEVGHLLEGRIIGEVLDGVSPVQ
jgi:hypothetical protein